MTLFLTPVEILYLNAVSIIKNNHLCDDLKAVICE
jgi:hypothetical protein